MANQVVKQCYACKAEDHEIKDCKKRINILLRYTDSRYTSTREMKSEDENMQKESMVCFATETEAKRAMGDIKHNYLHEG